MAETCRAPSFAVKPQAAPEPGVYVPPQYVCPKCGSNEVNRTYESNVDRLFVSCQKCAYGMSQPCLDAEEA